MMKFHIKTDVTLLNSRFNVYKQKDIVSANMALAGMNSIIPADEELDAMKAVGDLMSPMLRETSLGGIACSKTAKEIEKSVFQ